MRVAWEAVSLVAYHYTRLVWEITRWCGRVIIAHRVRMLGW